MFFTVPVKKKRLIVFDSHAILLTGALEVEAAVMNSRSEMGRVFVQNYVKSCSFHNFTEVLSERCVWTSAYPTPI